MDERTICCRGGGTLAASRRAIDALPPDSPLALMLNGSSSLAGGCAVDAELHALRVIFDWLEQGCEPSAALLRGVVQRGEATDLLETADYLLLEELRRPVQRALLAARLSDARDVREGGSGAFDAVATLLDFSRGSTGFSLLDGHSRHEVRAIGEAARGLGLQATPLARHGLPGAVVVAKEGGIAMSTRSSAASVAAAGRRRPDGVRGERMAAADRPRKQAGDGERVGNPQITPALVSSACCFVSKLHRAGRARA